MLPRMGFACCDVRDVSEAHIRAMDTPDAAGRRHIIFDRFMWFSDLADIIRQSVPGARPARRVAPDVLMRALGLVDPAIRGILPQLGRMTRMNNTRMLDVLGIEPRDARDSVVETARWLVERKAQ